MAIDRATRFVYTEVFDNKTMETTQQFLQNALKTYPFKIEKILTDDGAEFSYNNLPKHKKPKDKIHSFVKVYNDNNI